MTRPNLGQWRLAVSDRWVADDSPASESPAGIAIHFGRRLYYAQVNHRPDASSESGNLFSSDQVFVKCVPIAIEIDGT
jgi:hypothetical protein